MSSKQYFDDVATQWDTMREAFFPETVRETALRVAGVQPGQRATDLGAGTGFITEALLEQNLDVIAVDQSAEMLELMKTKFAEQATHLDVRQGDAEAVPLGDEATDYVFANMYLHHVESPANAIKEMARILKPGGKVVITDLDEHDFTFLREEHHDRWLGFKREDVEQWFTEAGLKNVGTDCVSADCCDTSANGENQAEISIFVAFGEK